jgi:hypothetical protein
MTCTKYPHKVCTKLAQSAQSGTHTHMSPLRGTVCFVHIEHEHGWNPGARNREVSGKTGSPCQSLRLIRWRLLRIVGRSSAPKLAGTPSRPRARATSELSPVRLQAPPRLDAASILATLDQAAPGQLIAAGFLEYERQLARTRQGKRTDLVEDFPPSHKDAGKAGQRYSDVLIRWRIEAPPSWKPASDHALGGGSLRRTSLKDRKP